LRQISGLPPGFEQLAEPFMSFGVNGFRQFGARTVGLPIKIPLADSPKTGENDPRQFPDVLPNNFTVDSSDSAADAAATWYNILSSNAGLRSIRVLSVARGAQLGFDKCVINPVPHIGSLSAQATDMQFIVVFFYAFFLVCF
jgi:hypothetical protein